MNKDASTRELRRQAVEMILEAVSLTDGLDEPTAGFVMVWPRSQARAAVDALSVSVDLASLPAEDVRQMLAEQLAPLRRYVFAIKVLAGERSELTTQQGFKRLETIRDMAQKLPTPPELVPSDHMLMRFALWVPEPDDTDFVRTMVTMLACMGVPLEQLRRGLDGEYVERRDKRRQGNEDK